MNDVINRFQQARNSLFKKNQWEATQGSSNKSNFVVIENDLDITIRIFLHGIKKDTIRVIADVNFLVIKAEKIGGKPLTEIISFEQRIEPKTVNFSYSTEGLEVKAKKIIRG